MKTYAVPFLALAAALTTFSACSDNAPSPIVSSLPDEEGTTLGEPVWIPNTDLGIIEVKPRRGGVFSALVARSFVLPPGAAVKIRLVQYWNRSSDLNGATTIRTVLVR